MVPTDLRARIRSAYRATSVQEGHRSFSDFVAGLLEAEATRLEGRYNDGRRFAGGQEPLTPGRPLDA
ncbi:ParB family protein [Aquipuribacter hungaricus]|uniref:Centromere-binding protein ParB C-terminal domain-containing protein n=1 Tax=Aquipuribacter hungaricus TaxID=545624 RepID=A0ABV7WP62_9MICO